MATNKAVQETEGLDKKIADKQSTKKQFQEQIDTHNANSEARKHHMEEIKKMLQGGYTDINLKHSMQNFVQHLNAELLVSNMKPVDTQALDNIDHRADTDRFLDMARELVSTYDKPKRGLLGRLTGSKTSSIYDLLENGRNSRITVLKTGVNDCDRELKNLNKNREAEIALVHSSGQDLIKAQEKYEAILLKQRNEAAVIKSESEQRFKGSTNTKEFREDRATAKLAGLEVLETEHLFQKGSIDRGKIMGAFKESKGSFLNTIKQALKVFGVGFASRKVTNDIVTPTPKTPP